MSKKDTKKEKPYTHPRWNEPIGGKIIGNEPLTEEEDKKAHEDTISILKSMGVNIKKEE